MGKKNPYVFTIGFNKADPSHRAVVEILNEKGRGMAQYITEAVLAYHSGGEQTVGNISDYDRIAAIVNEILNQRMEGKSVEIVDSKKEGSWQEVQTGGEQQVEHGFSGDVVDDIMESLHSFRDYSFGKN